MTSDSLSIDQRPQDGEVSIRVELVPQLFGNTEELQQEMVFEYIPPSKSSSGQVKEEPETERVEGVPILLEAWGECPDEEGASTNRDDARVDRLRRDIAELRLMMKAHQQRIKIESQLAGGANNSQMHPSEPTRQSRGSSSCSSTRVSDDGLGREKASTDKSGKIWEARLVAEKIEALERKVCMMESGLRIGKAVETLGDGFAVPIATVLSELDRQVSIIESKGPSDDDGVAAACASLDLLLEKQSGLELFMNLQAAEMNEIEDMYNMCMQAMNMGGEIIAVANSLRAIRSFEEQAEYYSAALTEIESQQDELIERIKKIRGEG